MLSNIEIGELLESSFADLKLSHEEKSEILNEVKSFSSDHERLAFVRNKAFKIISDQFDDPDLKQSLKALKDLLVLIDKQRPKNSSVEAFFTHHSDPLKIIQRELRLAKSSIDICVFTITDNRITDLISQAFEQGISVRIITDNDKLYDAGSDIKQLKNKGIEIAVDDGVEHMHHKFAIFDNKRLLNGSYNWTRGASEKNYENFLICEDPVLLRAYKEEFERLWDQFDRF